MLAGFLSDEVAKTQELTSVYNRSLGLYYFNIKCQKASCFVLIIEHKLTVLRMSNVNATRGQTLTDNENM